MKHYDRLGDGTEGMILQPTLDTRLSPGAWASTSEIKDNVHWLTPVGGPAFTFDVVVNDLDHTRGFKQKMDFVDPLGGRLQRDGTLVCARMTEMESRAKYGRGV